MWHCIVILSLDKELKDRSSAMRSGDPPEKRTRTTTSGLNRFHDRALRFEKRT
jgi:hypothetical protein